MEIPAIPKHETKRMRSLRTLNILDTEAEERFDRVTRLAKRLFNVPIALVSIVDENRQWFKSRQGLDASETPREISFCGHTILDKDIMVIENALKDHRFSDNPLVVDDPNIRFYAGCPLATNQGYNIGTLCLIDRIPRSLDLHDLESLKDLAKMIEEELSALAMSITDELTGISNRRGFFKISHYTFNMCKRLNTPMTLINIDLDKFKFINDTYGHCEGDRALKGMANILLKTFRDSDVIARTGGDEFCILCSNLSNENIQILIDRLQKNVGDHNSKARHTLDFSLGIMPFNPEIHTDMNSLVTDADRLMYANKTSGKNNNP